MFPLSPPLYYNRLSCGAVCYNYVRDGPTSTAQTRSSLALPLRVEVWEENTGKRVKSANVVLPHHCTVNHFQRTATKSRFKTRVTARKRFHNQIKDVKTRCPKVCVRPLRALLLCGLSSKLRKMPLSSPLVHYSCW